MMPGSVIRNVAFTNATILDTNAALHAGFIGVMRPGAVLENVHFGVNMQRRRLFAGVIVRAGWTGIGGDAGLTNAANFGDVTINHVIFATNYGQSGTITGGYTARPAAAIGLLGVPQPFENLNFFVDSTVAGITNPLVVQRGVMPLTSDHAVAARAFGAERLLARTAINSHIATEGSAWTGWRVVNGVPQVFNAATHF